MDDSLQWSVADGRLESVANPKEEARLNHKDSSRSRVRDGHGDAKTRKSIPQTISPTQAKAPSSPVTAQPPRSGQSGTTEDDPVDPVTLRASGPTIPHHSNRQKLIAKDFSSRYRLARLTSTMTTKSGG